MNSVQSKQTVGVVPDTRDWGEIRRAARGMVVARGNGSHFYEFLLAAAAPTFARSYRGLRSHPCGRRLLAEKPDLLALLSDDSYLASLPVGSLGHAYRSFLTTNRLDAGVFDLATVITPIAQRRGWDEDFLYAIVRCTALHDIHHVLGGYGPDMFGELGAIGFHCGQLEPSGPMKAIAIAVWSTIPSGSPRAKLRFFREAVYRGRQADNLMAAPYEELLDQPIDVVREQLGVPPSSQAHPYGHLFTAWTPPGFAPVTRWDYDEILRTALAE